MRRLALLPIAALVACSSTQGRPDAGPDAGPDSGMDAGPDAGPDAGTDGGPDAGPITVNRGPLAIATPNADPNGLWWEPSNSTLYIADNQNDAVLTWTDDAGLSVLASLPGPAGNEVGGIVRLSDGTLVVVEFGFGTAGAVVFVSPDGGTGTVPGLDPTKRRLGLTVAADGTLFDSYFFKLNGNDTGFVAQLDLMAGTETDVVTTSLQKPVGVVAVGGNLYVSDQTAGEIYAAPIANPASITALTTMVSPDLLSAGPNGTIFSGSPTGVVYQIDTTTGVYTTLFTASGTLQPRGTAFDAADQRLFVAEHDSAGVANYVEIVPIGS